MASKKNVTFTAPNGQTRTSKTMTYTHALAIFNPEKPWEEPSVTSWHSTLKLGMDASRGWVKRGYRTMVVPVTTDGTKDEVWADRIRDLRTQEDVANIPAMHILYAEDRVRTLRENVEDCETDVLNNAVTEHVGLDDLKRFRDDAVTALVKAEEELAELRVKYAPEPEVEAVPEPVKKTRGSKHSKRNAKTRFIKEVADAIHGEGGTFGLPIAEGRQISTGHRVSVIRDINGKHEALIVRDEKGNFFEFRCPFNASVAGQVATQIWTLMQTMGL